MIKKIFNKENIKQFISYFFVGGISFLVELGFFTLFSNVLGLHYLLATALAFIFSTTANWFLGRVWTFKKNKSYENKRIKELLLVFGASIVGLGLNELLMWIFVSLCGLDTDLLKVVSKVLATGIVFFWNFLSRKLLIYRETGQEEPQGPEEN